MKDISILSKKLGIELDESELKEILIHASFQPQTDLSRKKNKELIVYGTHVARCLHALYSYLNRKCVDEGSLSVLIASSHSLLIEKIYEKYQLVDYEIVSAGEAGKKHYDTAAKLLAIVYMNAGMVKTYSWLENMMADTCVNQNIDYKTVLQEYVQHNKLRMEYKIIGAEGPENDKIFSCELAVNKERIISKGRSKKAAQIEAAKVYIEKHRISAERKPKVQRRFVEDQAPITAERRQKLNTIYKQLGISVNNMPIEYMNAAFVHKSSQNDLRIRKTMSDNSMLTVIGSELAVLYTYDYLMASDFYQYIDVKKESAAYLNSDAVREALPDSWLHILISMGNVVSDNLNGKGNAKKEIYQSILACLVLYALRERNPDPERSANRVAKAMTETIHTYRKADHLSTLQEIAEVIKLEWHKEEKQGSNAPAHKPIFECKIHCKNVEVNINAIGLGGTKKKASNNAAKKVLSTLLMKYANRPDVCMAIYRVLEPEKYFSIRKEEAISKEGKLSLDTGTLIESLHEENDDMFDNAELEFLRNLCI